MKRKDFIRLAGPAIILLTNGRIAKAADYWESESRRSKILFRFAVASDGHYGQPDTDYANYFASLVSAINEDHARDPFGFTVINGDIIHDDKSHFPSAKLALDGLRSKYYVSQGNHDNVTAAEWESIWGMPVNLDFTFKKKAFLIGTTSNEKGESLCPDVDWFTQKLEEHRNKQVYIFVHINPSGLTPNAQDCTKLLDVFSKYPNIKAVFNGHDHDEEGIKTRNNIPYIFDAHFGGSWGTAYHGYRVVEVMKDGSAVTYVMNPKEKINNATLA